MKVMMVALLLWGTLAHAGATKAGDGGHGITCSNGPAMLLDLYEAENIYHLPFVFPPSDSDPLLDDWLPIYDARMRVEGIMGKNHPSLAIFDQAELFLRTLSLEPGAPAETWDAGVPSIPADCQLVQIARREEGNLNFLITVDSNYWMHASPQERAMLMIHEAAHTWFPSGDNPWIDSMSALRQFVGLLYATGVGTPESDEQIRKLLTDRQPVLVSH